MARGRDIGALAALLGMGAMAASRKSSSSTGDSDADTLALARKYPDARLLMTPAEGRAARRQALTELGNPNLLLTEDVQPVRTGPGTLLRTGMKKGGKVSASRRGDGIAKRGKTRGKMF